MEVTIATNNDRDQLIAALDNYGDKDFIETRIDHYLKHNRTIIVKEGEKIIGRTQWYPKENPKAGVAELEEVFVEEQYRGQGIGSKIIEKSVEEVKNFFNSRKIQPRRIYLLVRRENETGRRLYEKAGFKCITELNDLFADNEYEMFYCLNL